MVPGKKANKNPKPEPKKSKNPPAPSCTLFATSGQYHQIQMATASIQLK